MGHLDEALDDYAELPPNYLNQNPSVTSELLTGLYAGGYYKELVNVVEFLLKDSEESKLDGVNYAAYGHGADQGEVKAGRVGRDPDAAG